MPSGWTDIICDNRVVVSIFRDHWQCEERLYPRLTLLADDACLACGGVLGFVGELALLNCRFVSSFARARILFGRID